MFVRGVDWFFMFSYGAWLYRRGRISISTGLDAVRKLLPLLENSLMSGRRVAGRAKGRRGAFDVVGRFTPLSTAVLLLHDACSDISSIIGVISCYERRNDAVKLEPNKGSSLGSDA